MSTDFISLNTNLIIPKIKESNFSGKVHPLASLVEIKSNNWKNSFPYEPAVRAYLWHSTNFFHLLFEVDEKHIAARVNQDNGKVCKDSCVEFFISFDNEGYYNIEANCIGKILMSHRKSRKENVEYADQIFLNSIKRTSSLGNEIIELRENSGIWRLKLEIPAYAFFKHDFNSFDGLKARGNIYKCGDDLPEPHYVSWKPIFTEFPDFHRPEFFGDIIFEG